MFRLIHTFDRMANDAIFEWDSSCFGCACCHEEPRTEFTSHPSLDPMGPVWDMFFSECERVAREAVEKRCAPVPRRGPTQRRPPPPAPPACPLNRDACPPLVRPSASPTSVHNAPRPPQLCTAGAFWRVKRGNGRLGTPRHARERGQRGPERTRGLRGLGCRSPKTKSGPGATPSEVFACLHLNVHGIPTKPGMHWKGGGTPPPRPLPRAPSLPPATVSPTASASFNGIGNRRYPRTAKTATTVRRPCHAARGRRACSEELVACGLEGKSAGEGEPGRSWRVPDGLWRVRNGGLQVGEPSLALGGSNSKSEGIWSTRHQGVPLGRSPLFFFTMASTP